MTYKSFDSIFKILPNGTLSKNSVSGANIKADMIFLWMNRASFNYPKKHIAALIIAKKP